MLVGHLCSCLAVTSMKTTLQIPLNLGSGLFGCRLSFLTSALVHHSAEQLGRNMFIVFFFSQMVYRDLGAVGVWFTFLLAGLGECLYWYLGLCLDVNLQLCLDPCTMTFAPLHSFVCNSLLAQRT